MEESKIFELKKKVDAENSKLISLKGSLNVHLSTLKKKYKLNSVEQSKKELIKRKKKFKKLNKEITELTNELSEELDNINQ